MHSDGMCAAVCVSKGACARSSSGFDLTACLLHCVDVGDLLWKTAGNPKESASKHNFLPEPAKRVPALAHIHEGSCAQVRADEHSTQHDDVQECAPDDISFQVASMDDYHHWANVRHFCLAYSIPIVVTEQVFSQATPTGQ